MKSNKTRGEHLFERAKAALGIAEEGEPMEEIYVDVPPLKRKKMKEYDVTIKNGKATARDMDEGLFKRFQRMLNLDKKPEKVETEIVIKADRMADDEPLPKMPTKSSSSPGMAKKKENEFRIEMRALEERLRALEGSSFEKDKLMAEGLKKAIERLKKGE